MKRLFRAVLLVVWIPCVYSQDPYRIAPQNYQLEFENDLTRVSRATLRPGDVIPTHSHPTFSTVYVYLTDGGPVRFQHETPKFTNQRPAVKAGGIRINRGMTETHAVEYLGTSPSEYLRIELKNDPPLSQRTTRFAPDEQGPFENAKLRIRRVRCAELAQCLAEFPTVVVSIDKRAGYWVDRGKPLASEQSTTPLILVEFK